MRNGSPQARVGIAWRARSRNRPLFGCFSRLVACDRFDLRWFAAARASARESRKGDPPMLVLSRKENEKILFPHLGIALQILRVGGGKVRLGVEAPSDVSVVRYEIASEEQMNAFAERLKHTARDVSHADRK